MMWNCSAEYQEIKTANPQSSSSLSHERPIRTSSKTHVQVGLPQMADVCQCVVLPTSSSHRLTGVCLCSRKHSAWWEEQKGIHLHPHFSQLQYTHVIRSDQIITKMSEYTSCSSLSFNMNKNISTSRAVWSDIQTCKPAEIQSSYFL